MKKLNFILIFIACALLVHASSTSENIERLSKDIHLYSEAVDKVVKQNDPLAGIKIIDEVLTRARSQADYPPQYLASYMRLRGQANLRKGDYAQSEADYLQAIADLNRAGTSGQSDLSDAWYQLSLAYYYADKKDKAIEAANNCVKYAETINGSSHSNTLDAYSLRSNYHAFYNNFPSAKADRISCFSIIRDNIARNFAYLTESERAAYWNKNKGEASAMFTFAHKMNEYSSEFSEALYDEQLLAKGLLLTAESALQRAIDADPELAVIYNQIREFRLQASKAATTSEAHDATLKADRLERELGAKANGIHSFMNFLNIRANDVRKALSADDVAIEFVDYCVGKDSVMYAALVIAPEDKFVKFIPLIESRELLASDITAESLWRPVLASLKKQPQNIYFAPSGELYRLPIESLPLSDGRYMCDAYNMYRMSSTRWLTTERKENEANSAVIYGGLKYDLSIEDMVADTKAYENLTRSVELSPLEIERGSVSTLRYLPGSLREAEFIHHCINDNTSQNLRATLYTSEHGTETSFKALSGKNNRIIHISTHGFFKPGADDPLLGSGLYFAGANNFYLQRQIPEGTDDGILTALEVSDMDLSATDLVVLSACVSGLGNITADGVQGLQRGFKKAGCNSMIISLQPVDDEATQLLMTSFYQELLKGISKQAAFENAKRELRSNPKYADKKYWSAFVLLDANS